MLKFKWMAFFGVNLLIAIGIVIGYSVAQSHHPDPTITEVPQQMESSPSADPSDTPS